MDDVPTPAERLRSLLCAASTVDVVAHGRRMHLVDAHTVDPLGRLLLSVPDHSVLALGLVEGAVPARVEITDVAPVAVRGRGGARAAVDGQLNVSARSPLVAALDLTGAELTERGTTDAVDPAQFAAAEPDLLASRESELLCHLVAAHADLVAWLSRLVPAERLHGVRRVHPLRLDRFGVVLRLEFPGRDRDARLPFSRPLAAVEDAPSLMLELLARARMCRRRAG
jgi:hypothetical protein